MPMTQDCIRKHYEDAWKAKSDAASCVDEIAYSSPIEDAVVYPAYAQLLADLKVKVDGGNLLDVGSGSGRWVRFFLDHKTCTNFPDLQRALDASEQMPTYLLLERSDSALSGEHTHGAIFNGLRKVKRTVNAKPPFFDRFDKTYNEHELMSQWARIHGQVGDIEAVEVRLGRGESHLTAAYPSKTRDCHWQCEFYAVCPMFDDGSRAEDMLAAIYKVGGQLDRYPELTGGKDMSEVEDGH